jgi:uncharacterized protein (TIGR03437 family)
MGTSFSPAKPGETVVAYAVGFGTPIGDFGNAAQPQFGMLQPTPACQIGGLPALVTFAGLNGFPGLFQINLVVPPASSGGDNAIICQFSGKVTPGGSFLAVEP